MPLDPRSFPGITAELSLRQVGALVLLGLHFWRTGALPRSQADAARILGIPAQRAMTTVEHLRPYFESGAYLPILREAHLMKVARRAKIARVSNATRWNRRTIGGKTKS